MRIQVLVVSVIVPADFRKFFPWDKTGMEPFFRILVGAGRHLLRCPAFPSFAEKAGFPPQMLSYRQIFYKNRIFFKILFVGTVGKAGDDQLSCCANFPWNMDSHGTAGKFFVNTCSFPEGILISLFPIVLFIKTMYRLGHSIQFFVDQDIIAVNLFLAAETCNPFDF